MSVRQAGFIHSASIEGVLPLESRSAPIHDLFCCNGFDRSKRVEVMDGSSASLARSRAHAHSLSLQMAPFRPPVDCSACGCVAACGGWIGISGTKDGTSGSKQAWADNAIIGLRQTEAADKATKEHCIRCRRCRYDHRCKLPRSTTGPGCLAFRLTGLAAIQSRVVPRPSTWREKKLRGE